MRITAKPGPADSLLDIGGVRVGQAEDAKVRTGVTVILPDAPVAMGVDVRGGAPGTRDTDALDPTCLVEKVHGLVLSGGSVFGLAAADAVTLALSGRGVGLPLSPKAVPVVPSAILFDLANGGDKDWGIAPPYRALALQAMESAGGAISMGAAGAGFGARAGAEQGGIGAASLMLEDGSIVAALVAVNSFGKVEMDGMVPGSFELPKLGLVGANTTIGCVATNVDLDKAACRRMAIMAHDGLARTIRPLHTPFDGDTIFGFSTGAVKREGPLALTLAILGTLAADCIARAVAKAVGA